MTAIQFEAVPGRRARNRRGSARQRAGAAARRIFAALGEWRRRARDRAQLAALDDRMLADIGITRADAQYLSSKPFWRE
ncbi:MAG TPA: DUF1127 domain-containing protein [Stellaceae bacterium]|jgi:uncharacterized protein YjiS (DUF1127 family)